MNYIESLITKHRATREALKKEGKSYRSYKIAYENGYLMALQDIQDALDQPEKNRQLGEAMRVFANRVKSK